MKALRVRRRAALSLAALSLAAAGVVAGAQPASAATLTIRAGFNQDTVSGQTTMVMSSDGSWRFSGSGRADPSNEVDVTCNYFLKNGNWLFITSASRSGRSGSYSFNISGTGSGTVQQLFGELRGDATCSATADPVGAF